MPNLFAGEGSPYWYEWTIGQLYIVDMLNPDNEIKSVTLQSHDYQCIDDVIVEYMDGSFKCIQVKHTRADKNIAFNTLLQTDDLQNGKSLLLNIATDWQKVEQKCEVVVFTNRKESVANNQKYPSISTVINTLKAEADKNIPIDKWRFDEPKMQSAWNVLGKQLSEQLSTEEITEFINRIIIDTNQPSLGDIEKSLLEKIKVSFGINDSQTQLIQNNLDNALRKWATYRNSDDPKITPQKVWNRLSSNSEEYGEHDLPSIEPFFPSRLSFRNDLEEKILNREAPVIFLSGDPGSGKTTMITSLSNMRDKVIDLRFHAYKPIMPNTKALPSDSSVTVTSKALWGDLLSQLRTIYFSGSLYEFRVPIRNEFLSVEKMREEVLRLCSELSKIKKKTIIIAIDGIDHAARANSDNTFLSTLVPPESVPDNVLFLIAGQPIDAYDNYPAWLKARVEGMKEIILPLITEADILCLLHGAETEYVLLPLETLSSLIYNKCNGNTIAAVFSVEEAKLCDTIDELEKRLENRNMGADLTLYYESIWNYSLSSIISSYPFVEIQLATALSHFPVRLTEEVLCSIYDNEQISLSNWSSILEKLSPLVINDGNGYRLLHNDIRVYLKRKIIAKQQEYKKSINSIIDYIEKQEMPSVLRHLNYLDLLLFADKPLKIAESFSTEYVMEALALKRPRNELDRYVKAALDACCSIKDWSILDSVSNALNTFEQFIKCDDYNLNAYTPEIAMGYIFNSEKYVLPTEQWNIDSIKKVLFEINTLINLNEKSRALGAYKRWFNNLSPIDLIDILDDEEIFDDILHEGEKDLQKEFLDIFNIWGNISNKLGFMGFEFEKEEDTYREWVQAYFKGGFLKESVKKESFKEFIKDFKILRNMPTLYVDIIEILKQLSSADRWKEVSFIISTLPKKIESIPDDVMLYYSFFGVLSNSKKKYEQIIVPSLERHSLNSEKRRYDSSYENGPEILYITSFLFGYANRQQEISAIVADSIKRYYSEYKKEYDEKKPYLSVLFHACTITGRLLYYLREYGMERAKSEIRLIDFKESLYAIFRKLNGVHLLFKTESIKAFLFKMLKLICTQFGEEYEQMFKEFLIKQAEETPIDCRLELIWRPLFKYGYNEILDKWLNHWLGDNGCIWNINFMEQKEYIDRFDDIVVQHDRRGTIEKARAKLNWSTIGFIDHKEYTLEIPLAWFELSKEKCSNTFDSFGMEFLNIMMVISERGSNRLEGTAKTSLLSSAAKSGTNNLWRLINCNSEDVDWIYEYEYVIDAIISIMENKDFTKTELLSVWGLAIGLCSWQVESSKVKLVNLKDSIIKNLNRQNNNIDDVTEIISSQEWTLAIELSEENVLNETDAKREKFLKSLETNKTEDAINILYKAKHEGNEYESSIWDGIAVVVEKLSREHPASYVDYINKLITLTKTRKYFSNPVRDGSIDAYKSLFEVIDDKQAWDIIQSTIEGCYDKKSGITGLASNIRCFLLNWQKRNGCDAINESLKNCLDTYKKWINGCGFIPYSYSALLPTDDQLINIPENWDEFVVAFLIKSLQLRLGTRGEAALRGLAFMCKVMPVIAAKIINMYFGNILSKCKYWILLSFEKIIREQNDLFVTFKPIIMLAYSDENIITKLQAWIILDLYNRNVLGKQYPWTMEKPRDYDDIMNCGRGQIEKLIQVPHVERGSIHITNGYHTVKSYLRKFDLIGVNSDEIEEKFCNYLSKVGIPESCKTYYRTSVVNDCMLTDSGLVTRFYEFISCIFYDFNANENNIIPLCQVLLYGDDPFIFLQTPKSHKADWINDNELNTLSKTKIQEMCEEIINCNVKENEIVMGGYLMIFSHDKELVYELESCFIPENFVQAVPYSEGTIGGRTSLLYYNNKFESTSACDEILNFTLQAGTLNNFSYSSMMIIPSENWVSKLEWIPNPNNPLIWEKDGEIAAEYQVLHGPFRENIREDYHRQLILHRWVCNKKVLDEYLIKNKMRLKRSIKCNMYPAIKD